MDFNELIADFATRHNVADLTATDNAAPHGDVGKVHKALVVVTTTEGIAAVLQSAFAL